MIDSRIKDALRPFANPLVLRLSIERFGQLDVEALLDQAAAEVKVFPCPSAALVFELRQTAEIS